MRWSHTRGAFTSWILTTHLTSLPALQLRIPDFPGARFTLPNAQDANQRSNGVLSCRLSPSQYFRLDMGLQIAGMVLERALDPWKRATHPPAGVQG